MAATDTTGGAILGSRAWSLATFRTTTFMTALVLTFHLRGTLQGFLHRLDSSTGFVFFVMFWVATWIATRMGLRLAGEAALDTPASDAVPASIVAGGWNGVFVFAVLAVGVAARSIQVQNPPGLPALSVFLFGGVLGGLLAFTIGGIVGFAYGLIEAVVELLSRALFRWVSTRVDGPALRLDR